MLTTQTFEPLSVSPRQGQGRDAARQTQPGLLLGGAVGTGPDPNREIRMDYAVLELGVENSSLVTLVPRRRWLSTKACCATR